MRRYLAIFFVLVLIGEVLASTIFSEASAEPGSSRVVLNWVTKSETNVKTFMIMRSSDDENFVSLTKVNAKGPGTEYEYIDQNVMFKDFSPVFYKIRALNTSGEIVEETSVIAYPNVSGMVQTWGAIKKLFR